MGRSFDRRAARHPPGRDDCGRVVSIWPSCSCIKLHLTATHFSFFALKPGSHDSIPGLQHFVGISI